MAEVPLSEMRLSHDGKLCRLLVRRLGEDITQDVILANGRSNPFGWSVYDLMHMQPVYGVTIPQKIGLLYCGYPESPIPDYAVEVVPDNA